MPDQKGLPSSNNAGRIRSVANANLPNRRMALMEVTMPMIFLLVKQGRLSASVYCGSVCGIRLM